MTILKLETFTSRRKLCSPRLKQFQNVGTSGIPWICVAYKMLCWRLDQAIISGKAKRLLTAELGRNHIAFYMCIMCNHGFDYLDFYGECYVTYCTFHTSGILRQVSVIYLLQVFVFVLWLSLSCLGSATSRSPLSWSQSQLYPVLLFL